VSGPKCAEVCLAPEDALEVISGPLDAFNEPFARRLSLFVLVTRCVFHACYCSFLHIKAQRATITGLT
jgi:hypothetical protein